MIKRPLLSLKGKSVAVVGNSVSLFNSNHGKFIDSHDIVIRFNKTPTHYSSEYTKPTHGEKIDMWAFWSINAFMRTIDGDKNAQNLLNLIDDNRLCKVEMISTFSHRGTNYSTMAHRLYTHQDFKSLKRELNGNHNEGYNPSSGFLMLRWLSANKNLREVNIFGMDFKKTPTYSEKDFENNVENQVDKKCNHNFKSEEYLMNETIFKRRHNFRLIN